MWLGLLVACEDDGGGGIAADSTCGLVAALTGDGEREFSADDVACPIQTSFDAGIDVADADLDAPDLILRGGPAGVLGGSPRPTALQFRGAGS